MNQAEPLPYAEVIGDPISQSKSPLIHGFWLKRLGIEARYGARRVTTQSLADYFSQRRDDAHWRGCNITMPLKQAAIAYVDRVDPDAKAVGAINTVFHGPGEELIGTNTDLAGFLEPLSTVLKDSHLFRMARIFGTGGAARAIIAGLAAQGFALVVAGRSEGKARALLDELHPRGEHHTAPLAHFGQVTNFAFDDRQGCLDLLVNASPLGMRGQQELEFDWSHAPPGSIVYDIVTDPVQTEFLRQAEERGFATIGGLSMLIGQAAAAFEKFFGVSPPRDRDAELQDLLQR